MIRFISDYFYEFCLSLRCKNLFRGFQCGINKIVCQTKISLLLKMLWKQQHYLYTKFFYNDYNQARKSSIPKGEGQGYLLIEIRPK